MDALFYLFNKRKNSTLRPDTQDATTISCVIKDASGVVNPTIEINYPTYPHFNYCYIADFFRYYYISEWTYNKGLWTATLSVDVLATGRQFIYGTSAQVIFSSSLYDLNILDNRIAARGDYQRDENNEPFVGLITGGNTVPNGTFALVVLNNNTNWASGSATTYYLTYQQMQTFAGELMAATVWESLKQFFDNPLDGLIECYYLPIQVSNYISLSIDIAIQIGDYSFPTATGKAPVGTTLAQKYKSVQIEIPWYYDDFRKLSPYTEINLFVPYCGSKPIAPEAIYNIDYLFIQYSVDVITGNIQAIVYNQDEILEEFNGNCKIILPVGQQQARVDSIIGATGGAIAAVAGFASGGIALGAVGVLSAISSVVTPANIKQMGGFSGSILGNIIGNDLLKWQKFRLSVTSRMTTDEPDNMRTRVGNALNKVVGLSTLTGYVQTSGASVSAPGTSVELEQLNALLDSGIYLE